jgi:hypothetical protein
MACGVVGAVPQRLYLFQCDFHSKLLTLIGSAVFNFAVILGRQIVPFQADNFICVGRKEVFVSCFIEDNGVCYSFNCLKIA